MAFAVRQLDGPRRPARVTSGELRRLDACTWICDAAGLPLASLAEPREAPEDVCTRCRIPDELSRRPCLFMVPVKVRHAGAWKDLFACHWYRLIVREDVLDDACQRVFEWATAWV